MDNNLFNQILESKPQFNGKLRKEKWGGLYLIRETLTMEGINETSYDILKCCNGQNTVADIIRNITNEYLANPEVIFNEVLEYLIYLMLRKVVEVDSLVIDNNFYENIKIERHEGEEISNWKAISGMNYNVESEEKPNFFEGKGVIGVEPNTLSAPINVLIEFTNNCNLACVHCFADSGIGIEIIDGRIKGELSTEEWKHVIDNICDAGTFEIIVSGGEALMRKDIFEIMEYITQKTGGFCLLSNMTLITNEVAEKLKNVGCYKVEGNLDGYDDKTYDEFRGVQGSFQKTVLGIKATLKAGIPVRCNITATKINIYNLKEVVKTAYNLGVRELVAVPLEPGGRARVSWEELEIPMSDSKKLMKYYDEVKQWALDKYGNEFLLVVPTSNFVRDEDLRLKQIMDPNRLMPFCGAGKYHCSVDPYGNVILCPTAGNSIKINPRNCLKSDFKDIWKNADVFREIREFILPCYDNCDCINCTGGCHVRSFQKTGRVVGNPGIDCRKYQIEQLGVMEKERS